MTAKANKTDAEIAELKEQIRDLSFYLEATSTIQKNPEFCELQGGQVEVPTPPARKTKGRNHRR